MTSHADFDFHAVDADDPDYDGSKSKDPPQIPAMPAISDIIL